LRREWSAAWLEEHDRQFERGMSLFDDEHYEQQMQLMQEAVIQMLSRAIERTTKFPQNGYRRRLYFESMARLGEDLSLLSSAAGLLVRSAGEDLQSG
jgi:hypothetical protein